MYDLATGKALELLSNFITPCIKRVNNDEEVFPAIVAQ
jgi:hypothetical protein